MGGVTDLEMLGLGLLLDLTLTGVAFILVAAWAGSGLTTALFRYTVLATLVLFARLAPSLYPEYVESRRLLRRKKCWSSLDMCGDMCGELLADPTDDAAGIGGTGGINSGDEWSDRLVTPGM